MSRILIVGASGTVGGELKRLLQARGHEVLAATSRTPTAPDQVQLNVATRSGLEAAFERADRAFLLAPPGFARQDEVLVPLIEAAQARGLEKVVLMTALGANADEATPMRRAERRLQAVGLPWNVIRPNWFMQNFSSFWLHGIVEQGRIALPVGQAKGSFIDARDIAAVAAELLQRSDFDGQELDLTGPEALDHDEVAAILSRETGRAIRFEDIAPQQMLDSLLAAGLPRDYAEFMVLILGYFKAGYAARTTTAVADVLGRPAGRFEQYASDYRAAWLG
ncbi:NmrA family NAD(P)-binding protein [Azohydromonas lata]|uniref:NAD(P)H-binding protein n=1 Tax=Azohydromonas lata TaxID=45677 RepID=A0ABU5IPU4_9BURK|nr:NAD(P)H-binding protein [Azohydromonas lata]MDZ5460908.1 NAD(P)H-binding protein [Azohydromonas lata]